MNELRHGSERSGTPENGCLVAPYSPGAMSSEHNPPFLFRGGKIVTRQRFRNEAVAGLPPALGARLLLRGRSHYLKLDRNEQRIAHSSLSHSAWSARVAHLSNYEDESWAMRGRH